MSDQVIEAVRQATAVRNDPETACKIDDARVARKALADAVASVRGSLSVPQDDPVSRIARGEAA